MLTFDEAIKRLTYDPSTGYFEWRRLGISAGSTGKNTNGKSYVRIQCVGKTYLAHRLAFLIMTGSPPSSDVDHIDGDGTNNAWSNLRLVSRKENQRNQKLNVRNTSGCPGVFKQGDRWVAKICCRNAVKHLGIFSTKDEAIAVRRGAEKEFGFHENHGKVRPL